MNMQEKIQALADFYGLKLQICKLGEEGAELGAVIAKKFVQLQTGQLIYKDELVTMRLLDQVDGAICEELADVLLVAREIEYLMYAHHPEYAEYIENIMRQKADRQLERIKLGTKQWITWKFLSNTIQTKSNSRMDENDHPQCWYLRGIQRGKIKRYL